jgi:RNA polymerase sigma-70 factor (ECF subfamily)
MGGIRDYQPWWALHAHLLARSGDTRGARDASMRAAGMTAEPAVRDFLLARRARLDAS